MCAEVDLECITIMERGDVLRAKRGKDMGEDGMMGGGGPLENMVGEGEFEADVDVPVVEVGGSRVEVEVGDHAVKGVAASSRVLEGEGIHALCSTQLDHEK